MRLFKTPAAQPTPKPIVCDFGSGSIDFQALLREAVGGVNATHQKAVDDLLGLCGQLDEAVGTLSGGALRIKIIEISDSPDGVAYEMQLHDAQQSLYNFYMYKVPVAGYPIAFAPRGSGSKFNGPEVTATNFNALQQHFAHLMSDAQSPLVIQVSYNLRKASRPAWSQAA